MDPIVLSVIIACGLLVSVMLVVAAVYYFGETRMFRLYQAVHWYWSHWVEIVLGAACIELLLALTLLFLAPQAWWGRYDQPGVGVAESIMGILAFILALIVLPALLLPADKLGHIQVN